MVIACAVGTVGIIVGGYAAHVALSDPVGRAEAYKTVNQAGNRLAQQAYFEQTYQDIKATDRKLTQLAVDKTAKLDGADIRYSGAVSFCQQLIGDYNAAARKQVASKFRDVNLPPSIDDTDPTTDCKE
jgi:hypothetical protein